MPSIRAALVREKRTSGDTQKGEINKKDQLSDQWWPSPLSTTIGCSCRCREAPLYGWYTRISSTLSTSAQGKFSVEGRLAGEETDEDSSRVTASTMAPVWLGFDAARNRAFLKGW
jgi:hypothetical protein